MPRRARPAPWCAAGGYAVVGLAALVALVIAIPPDRLNRYDEGLVLLNALRVLEGQVPYRDFWTIYAPGQFWGLAAWFGLFEPSVLAGRLWDALMRVALVLACFDLVLAGGGSRRIAVGAAAVAVAWLWYIGFYGYPLIPASAAATAACAATLRWQVSGRRRDVLSAAVFTAVAAVFRHDVGAYTAAAMVAGMAASGQPQRLRRAVLPFVGVVAIAGSPVAAYLLLKVPFAELWQQLMGFPASVYPDYRSLPFPDVLGNLAVVVRHPARVGAWGALLTTGLMLLPLAVCGTALIVGGAGVWPTARTAGPRDATFFALSLLGLLGLLLFGKAMVRPSIVHVLPALLLAAVILLLWRPGPRAARMARAAIVLVVVLVPLGAGALAIERDGLVGRTVFGVVERWRAGEPAGIPRARGFVVADGQARAVRFIRRRTAPDEPILVAARRHDRVFVSDMLFYFLAARPPATRHAELHPGAITTRATQGDVIRELAARDVQWVAQWRQGWRREPNASARSSGVTALDCVLDVQYRVVKRFPGYWMRKRRAGEAARDCW